MYQTLFKRIFDLILASLAFLLLSPIFFLLTILLFFVNGGQAFFIQPRPGRYGKIFRVIKFKTMNDARDPDGKLLPDAERLTPIGSFVRTTSFDEIPQLLNVIKGDMSLVGPRPLLVKYLDRYTPEQARRHKVRPGITGWAQINGRNTLSWKEKFTYDIYYVDHLSFPLDCKILFFTLFKVIKREGIHSDSSSTMDEFWGVMEKE